MQSNRKHRKRASGSSSLKTHWRKTCPRESGRPLGARVSETAKNTGPPRRRKREREPSATTKRAGRSSRRPTRDESSAPAGSRRPRQPHQRRAKQRRLFYRRACAALPSTSRWKHRPIFRPTGLSSLSFFFLSSGSCVCPSDRLRC